MDNNINLRVPDNGAPQKCWHYLNPYHLITATAINILTNRKQTKHVRETCTFRYK